ncbi:MAG: V-type ATPase subunit [Candidatus Aenigmarchaeota archaeon]|nr:V-type ATPase subunit [Candidatus Aenigmarchaeota archaeon]
MIRKAPPGKKSGGKKKGAKLRFGTYPYTAVRVLAMKSALLGKDDYMRMQKMGMNEIIRFLAEGEYKSEIEILSKSFRGIELVNLSLNLNLAATVNKLLRISIHDEVKGMIRLYSNKWVVSNLKTVLRVKMNALDSGYIRYGIIPIEPATYEFCRALYESEPRAMAREIEKIMFIDASETESLLQEGNLMSLENALDREYYKTLYAASRNVKSKFIKEFLQNLVELMNIRNVVKLRISGVDRKTALDFVIGDRSRLVSKLLDASDAEKIRGVLGESRYSALSKGIEEDIANLENNLENFLLRYSSKLLHSKQMSISPIFGYLLAKEIEIRNLRLMLNSRDAGLEEDFVNKNLIISA